jgi:hypothetical protein
MCFRIPLSVNEGAIERSFIGRVVFGLSNEELRPLKAPTSRAAIRQDGPALYDEARAVVDGYYV